MAAALNFCELVPFAWRRIKTLANSVTPPMFDVVESPRFKSKPHVYHTSQYTYEKARSFKRSPQGDVFEPYALRCRRRKAANHKLHKLRDSVPA